MQAVVVQNAACRPLGSGLGLRAYGIEPRWVVIDGPAGQGTASLLKLVQDELAEHLGKVCPSVAGGLAEALVEDVSFLHSPGATVELEDGSPVTLRQLLHDKSLPPEARFALYMTDRVLHNHQARKLLKEHSLVIQGRGPMSTYAYECAAGGFPTSLFTQMTKHLAPERADLLIVLAPNESAGDPALEAYCNPPMDVLRLCARRIGFVSTDGRSQRDLARCCIAMMAGAALVIEV